MKKDNHPKISIKLDAETSMFFSNLINEGLAKFEVDAKMNEGEVHACMEKKPDGSKLIIRSRSLVIWVDDDDDKG